MSGILLWSRAEWKLWLKHIAQSLISEIGVGRNLRRRTQREASSWWRQRRGKRKTGDDEGDLLCRIIFQWPCQRADSLWVSQKKQCVHQRHAKSQQTHCDVQPQEELGPKTNHQLNKPLAPLRQCARS